MGEIDKGRGDWSANWRKLKKNESQVGKREVLGLLPGELTDNLARIISSCRTIALKRYVSLPVID